MLDFHIGHLDAPVVRPLVEEVLNIGVELVTFGKHVVQFMLTKYRTQSRLRELARRFENIGDPNDGFLRIDDSEVYDGVDTHRDVVTRNDVLRRKRP